MAKENGSMYRIGDYSGFMGVSADLLKHYERCGLIHARTAENGYRYYPFHESTRLLECMRLRSYGFTLGEMKRVLCELPYGEVQNELDSKAAEMEKQIRFCQMVVAEHRKVSAWMTMMREREEHITVVEAEPVLFLPHSRQTEFVRDRRVEQILEPWVSAMPMVKSCRLFQDIYADNPEEQFVWGLAVLQSDAQALELPVNDAVMRIDGGRQLHLNIHHTLTHTGNTPHYLPGALKTLRDHGAGASGPVLQFVAMTLACGDASHENCCWFAAPLSRE